MGLFKITKLSDNLSSMSATKREIDVAVWTAEQIIERYTDSYDAIEWLVMNLKDEAFKECAQYYDEGMNELMNQRNNSNK
jgi:hypothetical protein|tara:strand:+ start:1111 stop:1350 length:240 start_codon:yes stop_codon:yes gene_type:complete